ncbi:MAG: hypothetical protein GQF41_3283 [Candidatus Rifleibacterium amylolyticum]|nr:MAG: hypothetical protein GQF41_3283 [Candidatus Rifleibacterium amylolyticum]
MFSLLCILRSTRITIYYIIFLAYACNFLNSTAIIDEKKRRGSTC